MKIELLFFGIVKDIVGKSTSEFRLSNNCSIKQFKAILHEKYPQLADYNSFSVAVNENYVEDNYQLKDNDIVALIPPVSGG
ncbi:MoaD/ThiS family protein [Aureibaculum marinum]|uniref:Molybdopterin synthase sulfur carrier subunit n=1 Tax=Aureibaculum marinum TaxID=2487930 RepID=A0A3N4NPG8_9FLAO|nr:MoaD/ThiS family protein [Aureibaculum marinum]RPD96418.1 MoaD/ThiS family protein [Aureibaculum marinum]